MRLPRTSDRWFFLLPLLLYGMTCARQLGLPDSAIIVDAMRQATVSSHVNCHSLNNLLGWLCLQLPGSTMVWKAGLSSVLAATLAMAIFHRLLLAWGVSGTAGFLTAGAMTVSHSMWWHATQADSYALSALLFCASMLLALRDVQSAQRGEPGTWRLELLFLLAGLALFDHLQNGAMSIAAGVHLLMRSRRPLVYLRCGLAWLLGAIPSIATLLHDLAASEQPRETLAWAVGGGFRTLMFSYQPRTALAQFGHWLLLQFPSPLLVLMLFGLPALASAVGLRRAALYPASVFVVTAAFFAGYATWDQFAFYLPCFLCLGLLAGLGAARLMLHARLRLSVLVALCLGVCAPPLIYPRISGWVASGTGYWHGRYHEAAALYRDRYDLVGLYTDPILHDRGTVAAFVQDLAKRLPPRAWLIDDVSVYYQFEYQQRTAGLRPDVRLLPLRPLGMAGWGRSAEEVVSLGTLAPGRLFIVATQGPCEPLIAAFKARGRVPVPYPLGGNRRIYELTVEPGG